MDGCPKTNGERAYVELSNHLQHLLHHFNCVVTLSIGISHKTHKKIDAPLETCIFEI